MLAQKLSPLHYENCFVKKNDWPHPPLFRWAQSHAARGSEEEDCRLSDACRADIQSASEKQHGSGVNADSGECPVCCLCWIMQICFMCVHPPESSNHSRQYIGFISDRKLQKYFLCITDHIFKDTDCSSSHITLFWCHNNWLMLPCLDNKSAHHHIWHSFVVVPGFGGAVLPVQRQRRPAESLRGAESLQGAGGHR